MIAPRSLVSLLAFLFTAAAPALADPLYTQAFDGSYAAYISTTDPASSQPFSSYDNFTLGTAGTVNEVEWQGYYAETATAGLDTFTIDFFADNNGVPGALLSANSVQFTIPTDGYQALDFLTGVDPFDAAAGTTYWLEIASADDNFAWFTGNGSGGDGQHFAQDLADSSQSSLSEDDLAFSLANDPAANTAVTPEPSSLLLMATGSFLLAALARRQTRVI